MLLVWGRDTGTVGLFGAVVMVVQLAVLLLSVAVVENALKRTFGEERQRRLPFEFLLINSRYFLLSHKKVKFQSNRDFRSHTSRLLKSLCC